MATETVSDNRALRSALDNLLRINKITVQPHFSQALDEIVKAGLIGKDILLDMLQAPGPTQPQMKESLTAQLLRLMSRYLQHD